MAQDLFGMLDDAEKEAAANMNTQQPAIQPPAESPTGQVQPEAPPIQGEQPFNVLDAMGHVGTGIVHGAEEAVIGARKTVRAIGRAVLPESLQDNAIKEENDSKIQAGLTDKPTTLVGKIASDITQFGLGFVGGQKLLNAVGAGAKLAPVVKEIAASGIGTAIVADPNEARLSNLLQEYPFLENPVSEFLAAKADDSIAEGKFKAAIEDMLTTPVAMVLFKGVKLVKQGITGKSGKELPGVADDLLEDIKRIDDKPVEKFADNVIPDPVTPGTADVGPSQQILKESEAASKAEALATSSKGDPLFSLTAEQKTAFAKHVDQNTTQAKWGNLLDPVQGAFNYSKMDSPVEVKATLDSLANILKPQIDKNVGDVQSFAQIRSLANLVGSKPEQVVANLQTWGVADKMMAPTIVAAKEWMQSISMDIGKLARSIHTEGTGGASAKIEMLRRIDILADIEGMTKSLQKAAARTTAAGRIRTTSKYSGEDMKKMIDAYGGPEALDKLAERLVLAGDDPKAVIDVVKASGFRKFIDSHNELWINGILSGPKTHVVNVISTTVNTLSSPLNMIVGGTLRREWGDVREGIAVYRGLRQMIGDSLEMSRRAFATEKPILGGGQQLEHAPSISAANYNLDPKSWLGWGTDALGKVIRFPGRFLTAEDEFFKQMNYRAKLMAQASREAADMVKNGKLDPKKMVDVDEDGITKQISEVEKYTQDRFKGGFTMQETMGDPKAGLRQTFGTDENALRYAEEATFTQDLKTQTWLGNRSFGETLQTAANTHPLLRGLVMPFIKVPANLTRQVFDYTPIVGQLHKRYWAEIAAGGTRKSVAIGKLSLGSMVWTGAMMTAMEGGITGRAPGDKELRDIKLASGWQPYSFTFGPEGDKSYISFSRLDPIGMVFGLAADFAQMANQVDENQRNSMACSMCLALAENLSSKSYLKGLVEISSMMGSGYAKEDIAQRILNMRMASYVPNWMGAFRPDDEIKQVRTAMDAVMAKIPGLSEQVEARRDYLGQKKEYPMQYPWSAINPFTLSDDKADPVMKELARLSTSEVQAQFTQPREKLGTLDLTEYRLPSGQTAYDKWLEKIGTVTIGGRTFHDKLQDLFKSEKYKQANDGTSVYHTGKRITLIHVEQERYRKEALDAMLKDFQAAHKAGHISVDLRTLVHQDQTNAKRVERAKTPTELLRDLQ